MTGPDDRLLAGPDAAGAILTIDLGALQENYLTLARLAGNAECAAVVKGDAYGIGAEPAVRMLARTGCRTFFVALPHEGVVVRNVLPDAVIYVLNGLPPSLAPEFERHDLRPVLGDLGEIEEWAGHCKVRGRRLAAAIHVDTGINRLGLDAAALRRLAGHPADLEMIDVRLIMSHLACGDEPAHPMNRVQPDRFRAILARLPQAPASLANSAGTLNGADFHFDLVRPGIALYGGRAVAHGTNPLQPVVHLSGRVMQVRTLESGESVGYGATWTASRQSRIAVVSVGYADGYFRRLGAASGDTGASVYVGDHAAPVVGRVSMDMITVDVTDLPGRPIDRGAYVELLGNHVGVDDLASTAGTIGYEVLTNLGSRYARVYSSA